MAPNQIDKLLHSKGNHKENETTIYRLRGNFTNDVTNKGLVSKIYKQLIQFNNKKKKTRWNMGRRNKWTFFQRKHTDGQQTHENNRGSSGNWKQLACGPAAHSWASIWANCGLKRCLHTRVHRSTVHSSQPKRPSTDEWIKKMRPI